MNESEVFLGIIWTIIWIFLGPAIFMLIWNNIIPQLCGFNEITYWQSFFLGISIRLVNGSIGTHRKLDKMF